MVNARVDRAKSVTDAAPLVAMIGAVWGAETLAPPGYLRHFGQCRVVVAAHHHTTPAAFVGLKATDSQVLGPRHFPDHVELRLRA